MDANERIEKLRAAIEQALRGFKFRNEYRDIHDDLQTALDADDAAMEAKATTHYALCEVCRVRMSKYIVEIRETKIALDNA